MSGRLDADRAHVRAPLQIARQAAYLAAWLALALLLAACGALPTNAPEEGTGVLSPVAVAGAQHSPLPTATPVREALRLVVLHTNDNWGETEPCG